MNSLLDLEQEMKKESYKERVKRLLKEQMHAKAKKLLLNSVQIQETQLPDGKPINKRLQTIAKFNKKMQKEEVEDNTSTGDTYDNLKKDANLDSGDKK